MRTALAVDLGNSRVKVTVLDPGRGGAAADAAMALDWPAADGGALAAALGREVASWLGARGVPAPALAAVSSVAGAPRTEAMRQALLAAGVETVVVAPPCGLTNETRTPETVGLDRLYAARGALQLHAGAGDRGVVVVDVGTALTVDAARRDGPEGPRFLGGAIAPGPALGAEALARRAAQLPAVEPAPGAPAWGRDTPGALQAGLVVGLRGAAARLVEELAHATGLVGAPVLVTGGARAFLLEPTPFLRWRRVVADPWLVERGLVAAALESLGSSAEELT